MSERGRYNQEPPQIISRTESFVLGTAFEIAFWLAVGLLWLALDGGLIGAAVAIVLGGIVFFFWRALEERGTRPVNSQTPRSKWER